MIRQTHNQYTLPSGQATWESNWETSCVYLVLIIEYHQLFLQIMCKGMPVGWKSSWIKPGAKGDTAIKLSSGEAETAGAAEGLKLVLTRLP